MLYRLAASQPRGDPQLCGCMLHIRPNTEGGEEPIEDSGVAWGSGRTVGTEKWGAGWHTPS